MRLFPPFPRWRSTVIPSFLGENRNFLDGKKPCDVRKADRGDIFLDTARRFGVRQRLNSNQFVIFTSNIMNKFRFFYPVFFGFFGGLYFSMSAHGRVIV